MSPVILHIETTTKNCSVGISRAGKLLALKELNDDRYSHAENIHPFIDLVLEETSLTYSDLSAVSVSQGPGSYTGLRIGVSVAKGLCFALDIPLIAVATLEILARSLTIDQGLIIPMLDARRMEVYQAVYSPDYQLLQETKAQIVASDTYDEYLSKGAVYFVGDAVPKCQTIISHKNAFFIENQFPSAKQMPALSYQKFLASDFVDVAYFEPYYLKDFIAVKSTKKYF